MAWQEIDLKFAPKTQAKPLIYKYLTAKSLFLKDLAIFRR